MGHARFFPASLLLFALAACAGDDPTGVSSPGFPDGTGGAGGRAAVGKLIFFDPRLSVNENQSCAGCHHPKAGWTGPVSQVNAGGAVYEGSVPGLFLNRKPPSSAYATFSPVLHMEMREGEVAFVGGNLWSGGATGELLGNPSADQALNPFLNSFEEALSSPADVVGRICTGRYGGQFRQVWGESICDPDSVTVAYNAVGLSIAAFEASPESNAFTSRYDAYRAGRTWLAPLERKGLELFTGQGGCVACHPLEPGPGQRALFTDFSFHNIGTPKNPANPWYTMPSNLNPSGASWVDRGLGGFLARRSDYAAYSDANIGRHKVPTLRNVDLRPNRSFVKAYGHNGYFKTLEGMVHFLNTRDVKPTCPGLYTEAEALVADCWPAAEVPENMERSRIGDLKLTAQQEAALVAFLRTLSDGFE